MFGNIKKSTACYLYFHTYNIEGLCLTRAVNNNSLHVI